MLLGTTTIIVVVGGCKSIIPIFKEVTPEKNGWNKKGGNFLISREGQLCLVVKFAQSRENVSILDRNFPAPRLLLTWQPSQLPTPISSSKRQIILIWKQNIFAIILLPELQNGLVPQVLSLLEFCVLDNIYWSSEENV